MAVPCRYVPQDYILPDVPAICTRTAWITSETVLVGPAFTVIDPFTWVTSNVAADQLCPTGVGAPVWGITMVELVTATYQSPYFRYWLCEL